MLCAIAKLSAEAAEKLNTLRNKILSEEQNRSPLYGHITLATWLPEDDAVFAEACEAMLRGIRAFTVRYEKIEVLKQTSILVATPAKSEELSALHSMLAGKFSDSLDQWTRDDTWYPHTTLLHDPAADLDSLCRAARKLFVPFEARIRRIELSKVGSSGYTILKSIRLD